MVLPSIVLERTPPLDHAAALTEAIAWLAGRDPAERSPRERPAEYNRRGPDTLPVR